MEPKSFFHKSKYSFFNVLSYCCGKASAQLLLKRLCTRGRELCSDPYLDLFDNLPLRKEVRSEAELAELMKI